MNSIRIVKDTKIHFCHGTHSSPNFLSTEGKKNKQTWQCNNQIYGWHIIHFIENFSQPHFTVTLFIKIQNNCGINHHQQWLHLSFHLHSLTIQPRNKATIIILFATWAPQLRVSGQQYGTWNTSEAMLFLPYAENLCFPSLIQNKITVNGINLHTCCDQVSCNNIVFSLWKDRAIFLFRVCTIV